MRVLFVCLGNICRSPSAEGVFRQLLAKQELPFPVEVDSAGTHAYHVGKPPDQRSIDAAHRRGIDISPLRARIVTDEDFARFDLLLAMDRENLALLQERSPPQYRERIRLFLEYAPHAYTDEVPDPYYGAANGFETVLDLLEEAAAGLLVELSRQR